MGNGIEEHRIKERIKISSLKHRGDINAIADETGIDPTVIKKQLEKIKKERDENVNTLISQTLMQYLFEGHQQRVVYMEEMLKLLRGAETLLVSDCCKLPIKEELNSDGKMVKKCRGCSVECTPMRLSQNDVYHLKIKLLNELKLEDEALVEFACKMGYSNAQPVERAPIFKQEFIVVGNNKNQQGEPIKITAEEAVTMKQIDNMPPSEREKLRNDLKKKIVELSNDEVNVQQTSQTTEQGKT